MNVPVAAGVAEEGGAPVKRLSSDVHWRQDSLTLADTAASGAPVEDAERETGTAEGGRDGWDGSTTMATRVGDHDEDAHVYVGVGVGADVEIFSSVSSTPICT